MNSYVLVDSVQQSAELAQKIAVAPWVGLDLETTGLDPLACKPRLVTLNVNNTTYVCDVWKQPCNAPNWDVLRALADYTGPLVGHNLGFDACFGQRYLGLSFDRVWDTFRASRLIFNGREHVKHDLYTLLKDHLCLDPPAEDLAASDWSGNLTPKQLAYAAADVQYIGLLRNELESHVQRLGLQRALDIENNVVAAEASLKLAGFAVDVEAWRTLAHRNIARKEKIAPLLFSLLANPVEQLALFGPPDWNLDSPAQLLESLSRMGFNLPNTDISSLATISDHELRDLLMEYRGVSQSVKSFGLEWLKHVHSETGRVHPGYWPFTGAGRYSCSKPNIQQVPHDSEFRACFTPGTGRSLVICDYGQVELRIAAQISGDPELRRAYREGLDVHTLTAQALTGRADKEARHIAKPVNFGLLYGMGAPKLRTYSRTNYGIELTEKESETYRNKYFGLYKGLKAWHRRAGNPGNPAEPVRTLSGRLRYLASDAYSERLNTPVQGTGADGIKIAMRKVWDSMLSPSSRSYYHNTCFVAVVHDEIVLECDEGVAPVVAATLTECMVDALQPYLPDVPVVAEAKIAESWAGK